jgi:hypothetical protein
LDFVFDVPSPATDFIFTKNADGGHFRAPVSARADLRHHSGTLDTGEYVSHTIVLKFMSPDQKRKILSKAKDFFRERIALPHKANIEKLDDPAEFNINPFLHYYLAKTLCGDTTPESLARALVYPRVLGTSIATTFGTQMQFFCSEVLEGFGSKIILARAGLL